ncbi:MAG: non-heme iron oxygenase ferredoxin subunit [Chromatiales bacterium]|jgi:3-phenylpropionate/trans-cinnamate dioxygenase ferredoxin subunit|nr:non-heme iron oxygenase ferredoxin subunit [Chromatiales bacterium]MDH3895160.1 non-heme iron oxygenase ferredoxin subunit [Chromatiales bacterium]MDH3932704.1 non-heme iron oxygenase ferredoxin subunit [Chromatiales bacterium]MDH3945361.1 non-heme iron oxygenase ferredoxin subunit [Chromatiales bacterium]MDH4015062.1 non-heme iron oxygenase ferredoxin subunit [Chromatiales bacterium]
MSDSWIDVALASAVAPGGYEVVDTDDQVIAVVNVGGQFFAIEDVCTHDGEELTGGPIEDAEIVCPRHGARFCLRTGAALTAPAYEPVRTFPVRVQNGMIQVSV